MPPGGQPRQKKNQPNQQLELEDVNGLPSAASVRQPRSAVAAPGPSRADISGPASGHATRGLARGAPAARSGKRLRNSSRSRTGALDLTRVARAQRPRCRDTGAEHGERSDPRRLESDRGIERRLRSRRKRPRGERIRHRGGGMPALDAGWRPILPRRHAALHAPPASRQRWPSKGWPAQRQTSALGAGSRARSGTRRPSAPPRGAAGANGFRESGKASAPEPRWRANGRPHQKSVASAAAVGVPNRERSYRPSKPSNGPCREVEADQPVGRAQRSPAVFPDRAGIPREFEDRAKASTRIERFVAPRERTSRRCALFIGHSREYRWSGKKPPHARNGRKADHASALSEKLPACSRGRNSTRTAQEADDTDLPRWLCRRRAACQPAGRSNSARAARRAASEAAEWRVPCSLADGDVDHGPADVSASATEPGRIGQRRRLKARQVDSPLRAALKARLRRWALKFVGIGRQNGRHVRTAIALLSDAFAGHRPGPPGRSRDTSFRERRERARFHRDPPSAMVQRP